MNIDYLLALILFIVLIYFINITPRKYFNIMFQNNNSPFYDK